MATTTNFLLTYPLGSNLVEIAEDIQTLAEDVDSVLNAQFLQLSGGTLTGTLIGTNTTDASSSTTGAWRTAGGLGVAKKLYVGDNLVVTGNTTLTGNISSDVAINKAAPIFRITSTSTGPSIYIDAVTSNSAGIFWRTGSSTRWGVRKSSAVESGGNAGSNFGIDNYDDSGTIIGTPLSIRRTDGLVTLTGSIAAAGLSGSLLSSASPVMNGSAAAGTATVPSRQDHVHPSDTSRAPTASPTFTGTVTLPSTTSIGSVSSTELGYLDGVTSAIQTQISAKANSAGPTFTGTVVLPSTTSIGTVSSTEIGYVDGVTSAIQTQIDTKAPIASPTFTGKVTTAATSTSNAGLNMPHGTGPTSPVNGDIWTTTSGVYVRINGSTIGPLGTGGAGSSAWGSITGTLSDQTDLQSALGAKAPLDGPSFTGVPTAPTAAADTDTTQIATTSFVVDQASTTSPLINGTAAAGTSLRYSRQDHIHPTDTSRAPLASPALTGTPTAPTAAGNTNTTQIATTAFVVGQSGGADPTMNGTAAVGNSLRYSRQDHVHPSDTSRAPLASPTFTGTVTLPTLVGSSTTDATSSVTGAFKTAGGMGVAKQLYVGTNLFVAGTLDAPTITGPAWANYSPTVVQVSSRTRTINRARYIQIGKKVTVEVYLVITQTGTAGNDITVSLPVTGISSFSTSPGLIGAGLYYDASALTNYPVIVCAQSATTVAFIRSDLSNLGYLGSAAAGNFATANNDEIRFTITYEAA